MSSRVSLKEINKSFIGVEKKSEQAHPIDVLKNISLDIQNGEFLVLVGPSGCGKSTLLRIIAGLDEQTKGEVWIGDKCVDSISPKDRDVAMVFQNYALYPHMTVFENMAFALKMRKIEKGEIKKRVEETAEALELSALLKRKPRELSGGQRQRVALGRAIVRNPQVFLMDEPLSNLDARLRAQTRLELQRLHQTYQTTTIYVTHDQVEAMTLGHRVAVMHHGVLQQVDTPEVIYRSPANVFVGQFIGQMSLLEARFDNNRLALVSGESIDLPDDIAQLLVQAGTDNMLIGVRPEHFKPINACQERPYFKVSIKPTFVESLGKEKLAYGNFAGTTIAAELPGDYEIGEQIELGLDIEKMVYFSKSTGNNLML